MEDKKTDRRVRKTKNLLRQGLTELLAEKSAKDIGRKESPDQMAALVERMILNGIRYSNDGRIAAERKEKRHEENRRDPRFVQGQLQRRGVLPDRRKGNPWDFSRLPGAEDPGGGRRGKNRGAFLTALGGEWVAVPVRGPLGEEVPASFGVLPDGTAVIEAAAVFGPQKGADPRMVGILDAGLRNLASAAARNLGRDLLRLPGMNRAYRSCAFPLAPQPL